MGTESKAWLKIQIRERDVSSLSLSLSLSLKIAILLIKHIAYCGIFAEAIKNKAQVWRQKMKLNLE